MSDQINATKKQTVEIYENRIYEIIEIFVFYHEKQDTQKGKRNNCSLLHKSQLNT